MPVFIENQTPSEKISPFFERRIVNLENLMTVVCDFTNGPAHKPDPPHSHPHEQITYVAEGDLYFYLDNAKFKLQKGDVISVPPEVPHCIQTISKLVRLIDSFSPVREDFLKKE
jgi:quercetin dioxygenase-like cupin family protein